MVHCRSSVHRGKRREETLSVTETEMETEKRMRSMASSMRIALLQLRVTGNKRRDIKAAEKAIRSVNLSDDESNRCDLVVLPEMWNCPYDNSFFKEYSETTVFSSIDPAASAASAVSAVSAVSASAPAPGLTARRAAQTAPPTEEEAGPSCSMMSALARELGVTIIGGTIPELVPSQSACEGGDAGGSSPPEKKRRRQQRAYDLYNTCFVFGPQGQLVGRHRKVHLFDIDIPGKMTFKESDTLTAGDQLSTVVEVPLRGGGPHARVGVGICYDLRFPEMAMLAARERRVDMMVYPAAFNTVR